jgi:hypothetical protein
MRAPVVLAVVLCAGAAHASMNETLDISGHLTRSTIVAGEHVFDANGFSYRNGQTQHDLRYGVGLGVAAPPMRAVWLTGEVFVAYAPNGCENLRPYVELRGHVDRLQIGGASFNRLGFGPRFGVLLPLSEYFFVDIGIGKDVIGSDELRSTIGIGLPIPLSHL